MFAGISKLSPAQVLICDARGDIQLHRYWSPLDGAWDRDVSEEEATQEVRRLLEASVQKRLMADVPVGCFLSGGLDSSSVVATLFAQKGHPRQLQTFSAIFPGYEKDESSFIRLVNNHFPIDNHTTEPCAADLVRDFEKLVYHQEEPFLSSSIYAQYKVFGLAHRHSVKVLLDGQGADELLAGYHKYYHWYWQELYRNDKKAFVLELEAARESGVDDRWTWRNRLAANLPGGSLLTAVSNGTATLLLHPGYAGAGVYTVQVTTHDNNGLSANQISIQLMEVSL